MLVRQEAQHGPGQPNGHGGIGQCHQSQNDPPDTLGQEAAPGGQVMGGKRSARSARGPLRSLA